MWSARRPPDAAAERHRGRTTLTPTNEGRKSCSQEGPQSRTEGGPREESRSRGWEGGWTASTKRRTIDGGETPLPTQRMSTKT